jgi:hypothetical protein
VILSRYRKERYMGMYAGYWTLGKVFKWAEDAEDWMKG